MATEPEPPRLTPPQFDRALMAVMIGQDALVSLLMAKGFMTDEELAEHVRAAKERIASDIAQLKQQHDKAV